MIAVKTKQGRLSCRHCGHPHLKIGNHKGGTTDVSCGRCGRASQLLITQKVDGVLLEWK